MAHASNVRVTVSQCVRAFVIMFPIGCSDVGVLGCRAERNLQAMLHLLGEDERALPFMNA